MTALDDLFYCCLVGVWHRHNQFHLQAETAVVTRTLLKVLCSNSGHASNQQADGSH
jgi:hypothetical protein